MAPDTGGAVVFQLRPFRHPYLRHLWLQHQRLWAHPRNVYVDLTVIRGKEEQLNTQTQMGLQKHAQTHGVHCKILQFYIVNQKSSTALWWWCLW